MSVFVTRKIPDAGLARLADAGVRWSIGQLDGEQPLTRERLLEGVRTHEVLLSLLTERIDREVLEANPRLRGVSNMAVGVDNIDVEAAAALGIPVGNTPGVLTEATADLTWALLLAAARRLPQAHAYMVSGRFRIWGPELYCGLDVGPGASNARRVLGIVGFGRIGEAVARRATGFDMEVIAHGSKRSRTRIEAMPRARAVSLEELLERSDFVSLHVPLTPESRHLIGADQLARMKPTAVLINTARGPVVDETALVAALRARTIAAAALDVYEDEPRMAPGLAALDNVVLLPHIASATRETRDRMAVLAAENAIRFLG